MSRQSHDLVPDPGQVPVKMASSGVCAADVKITNGDMPRTTFPMPRTPGRGHYVRDQARLRTTHVGDRVVVGMFGNYGRRAWCDSGQSKLPEGGHLPPQVTTSDLPAGGQISPRWATAAGAVEIVSRSRIGARPTTRRSVKGRREQPARGPRQRHSDDDQPPGRADPTAGALSPLRPPPPDADELRIELHDASLPHFAGSGAVSRHGDPAIRSAPKPVRPRATPRGRRPGRSGDDRDVRPSRRHTATVARGRPRGRAPARPVPTRRQRGRRHRHRSRVGAAGPGPSRPHGGRRRRGDVRRTRRGRCRSLPAPARGDTPG